MGSQTTISKPNSLLHASGTIPAFSPHLDLFRGLAAITVMLGHLKFLLEDLSRPARGVSGVIWDPGSIFAQNPLNPAHQAVIIFFVLSGVLVGGSVLREQRMGRFSWTQYWLKRLSRLLTVLVPALIIGFFLDYATRHFIQGSKVAALGKVHDLHFNFGLPTFVANLFFLETLDNTRVPAFGSNTALWSLAYEFWYYMLFPLVISILFVRSWTRRIVFFLLSAVVGCFLWKQPLAYFSIWLMGACITALPLVISDRARRWVNPLLFLQFLIVSISLWSRPLPNAMIDDLILGLSLSVFLYGILHGRNLVAKRPYAVVADHLARSSFTLYLFHLPVMHLVLVFLALSFPAITSHRSLAEIFIASVVYGICYCFYFAFERRTDIVRKTASHLLGITKPNGPVLRTSGIHTVP